MLTPSANLRAADEDSFALDVQRVPGSSAKNFSANKSLGKRQDLLASIPDQDESFQLQINTVEDGKAAAEDGSQRDRLVTFVQSPITQGVASSMDISPGQGSFGFDV